MTWGDIGTWLGTALSAIGAIIAVWQARQAEISATRAEAVRGEITKRNEQTELTGLDTILSSACQAMDKYGPGARPIQRRGATPETDAATVRTFTASLDRHSDLLEAALGISCGELRDRVNDLLAEFGSAASDAERLEKGRSIYFELTKFRGPMKQALDRRIFGGPAFEPRVRSL